MLPEFWILLELLVLTRRQTGAKQKILEGILVQNPMDDHSERVPFEVDPIVAQTIAGQCPLVSSKSPKITIIALELLR